MKKVKIVGVGVGKEENAEARVCGWLILRQIFQCGIMAKWAKADAVLRRRG